MNAVPKDLPNAGKTSMKTIFGRKKVRKDGSEGKNISVESVENLQREDRELWICYSSLDSMSTLRLYESLKSKLQAKEWVFDGCPRQTMYNFYEEYWLPFGDILVKMETEGMLVDRAFLSEIEKTAVAERKVATDKFRKWASKYCPDAKYMNVNSDTQIRQLLFAGIENRYYLVDCAYILENWKLKFLSHCFCIIP
jgi:DNA polymerase I